jgi:hypothetical protein
MVPPGWENKIMHATLRIGNANVIFSPGTEAICADMINKKLRHAPSIRKLE